MNIIRAGGGLANQIYQYIFMRSIETKTKVPHIIDNLHQLAQENPNHNGFEIDKVFPNLKLKCVTDYLKQDEIDEIIKIKRELGDDVNMPNLLNKYGFNIKTLVWEQVSIPPEKHPEYSNFTGNQINCCEKDGSNYKLICHEGCYYIGVWFAQCWFDPIKEQVLKELEFPPIPDKKNFDYFQKILTTLSVGVHVRRGDFLGIGWDLSAEKYAPAINQIRKQAEEQSAKPTFFVISDDIQYCKDNKETFGFNNKDDVIFVEGNTGNEMNYIDMQLLSNCKLLVLNRYSSFSRVSGWLNKRLIGTFVI